MGGNHAGFIYTRQPPPTTAPNTLRGGLIEKAYGNSLRALVKYFDGLSNEEITGVNIPTAVPLVYEFDQDYLGAPQEITAKCTLLLTWEGKVRRHLSADRSRKGNE